MLKDPLSEETSEEEAKVELRTRRTNQSTCSWLKIKPLWAPCLLNLKDLDLRTIKVHMEEEAEDEGEEEIGTGMVETKTFQ